MSSTGVQLDDGRVLNRMENYTKFWQKDPNEEQDQDNKNRIDSYTEVVNGKHHLLTHFFTASLIYSRSGYYDGATELYEYGWAQSFHFSRFNKGEAFLAALARHEHYLAAQMNLKPGMRVLDVGCGVGGPAREIAQFTDCQIIGLNNNEFQVQRARKYTQKAGLENQVTFVKGDFMKLVEKFGENSFDAGIFPLFQLVFLWRDVLCSTVYAIEATVHAPTWEGVYGEILKVLKPGGVVSRV